VQRAYAALYFSLGTPRTTAHAALTQLSGKVGLTFLMRTAVAFLALREQTQAMEISNETEISSTSCTIPTQAFSCHFMIEKS
jgi:hypothetical protein